MLCRIENLMPWRLVSILRFPLNNQSKSSRCSGQACTSSREVWVYHIPDTTIYLKLWMAAMLCHAQLHIWGKASSNSGEKKNAKWQKCLKNCTKIDHSNCSCLQIFFMSKKTRLDVFFCSSSLCCSSSNQSNCLRFELDDNSLRFFFF